ncbi:ABC transporter permease subunit [Facklamia sp. DSM 111018]|uniref:ABC transporter permease subunit n=2 Tax=Facklamia lactis TaxID=2749967 RepID=A0ABS0LRK8_9LACT|nr:ABC transporter permease subunit [Facklamia lactis]MBG9986085.1 ABC transporter permease subunit [Facklamia lactis]
MLFLPQLLITTFLMLGVVIGMVQSFGIIPSLDLTDFTFDYYLKLFTNQQLSHSVWFSLKIALFSALLSTFLGLVVAYFWLQSESMSKGMQIIIRLPIIIPHIIVTLFMMQMLGRTGLLARIFFSLGFDNAQKWFDLMLYNQNAWGIILAFLWKEVPFVIFYCYPILSSISSGLGEAARTLGANQWQSYLKIILPLAKNTIFSSFFIIFMYAFGSYEVPALLGPTLPKALPVASYQAYTHPDLLQRPLSMALNGLILVVGLVCAGIIYLALSIPDLKRLMIQNRLRRRMDETENY